MEGGPASASIIQKVNNQTQSHFQNFILGHVSPSGSITEALKLEGGAARTQTWKLDRDLHLGNTSQGRGAVDTYVRQPLNMFILVTDSCAIAFVV